MQKMTKGAIAAGAAALLLVGGGGTFMSWNDEEAATTQAINSGSLELVPGTKEWTLNEDPVGDIEAVEIVPGDVLTFKQPVSFTTSGNSIQATLKLTDPSINPGNAESTALFDELVHQSDVILVSDSAGVTQVEGESGSYELAGDTSGTFNVTASFDFTSSEAITNASQKGKISFSNLGVVLDQKIDSVPEAE